MKTSRITRVGSRKYITRIAAVSQKHVLVRTTPKVTQAENEKVSVFASKLTWFCVGGRNVREFSLGDRS